MRKLLATLSIAVMAVLVNPAPAQAHHSGPYVANRIAHTVDVMIRNHDTGLTFWQYVGSNRDSMRGARGVFVYRYNKLYYRSIATGVTYWSYCGREYERLGYTWTGKPFMPVTDRSIVILEDRYAPECAW